jgi:hypothetical protein
MKLIKGHLSARKPMEMFGILATMLALAFAMFASASESVLLSSKAHDVLLVINKIESVELLGDNVVVIRTSTGRIIVQPDGETPEFKGVNMGKVFLYGLNKLISFQSEITDAATLEASKTLYDLKRDTTARQLAAIDVLAGDAIFPCSTINFIESTPKATSP